MLARDLGMTPQAIKRWFAATPLPDIRNLLADLCRRIAADNPRGHELAREIEKLGPPERQGRTFQCTWFFGTAAADLHVHPYLKSKDFSREASEQKTFDVFVDKRAGGERWPDPEPPYS